tara:strand:- start:58 stop:477 length:420 start_codon:yes stop_codon:yes gene_type:complete
MKLDINLRYGEFRRFNEETEYRELRPKGYIKGSIILEDEIKTLNAKQMESALMYRVLGMGPKRAKNVVEALIEEGFRMVADKSCDVETDDDIVFVDKNDVAKALSKTKGFGIVKSKKVINALRSKGVMLTMKREDEKKL